MFETLKNFFKLFTRKLNKKYDDEVKKLLYNAFIFFLISILGASMNYLVIRSNDGKMPVFDVEGSYSDSIIDERHSVADENTKFPFLADWVYFQTETLEAKMFGVILCPRCLFKDSSDTISYNMSIGDLLMTISFYPLVYLSLLLIIKCFYFLYLCFNKENIFI